jgi:hypothetical protein
MSDGVDVKRLWDPFETRARPPVSRRWSSCLFSLVYHPPYPVTSRVPDVTYFEPSHHPEETDSSSDFSSGSSLVIHSDPCPLTSPGKSITPSGLHNLALARATYH